MASIVKNEYNLYSLALTREVVIKIFGGTDVSDDVIEFVYGYVCSLDYDVYDEFLLGNLVDRISDILDIS